MPYATRQLDASTWDAFAELVERNNGVYGGCWCIGYHPECAERGINYREAKEDRVRTGRAHAALVIDEDGAAQGWCQYGTPEEFRASSTGVNTTRTSTAAGLADHLHLRRQEASRSGHRQAGLEGALDQIARLGGGRVEAIPEVTAGREAQGRFLFSATVELFEQYGFTRGRRVGKHAWIVSRAVEPV